MFVFVLPVYLLVTKAGLEKCACILLTKRQGQTRDQNLYQFPPSNFMSPAGFGASLVLSNVLLSRN